MGLLLDCLINSAFLLQKDGEWMDDDLPVAIFGGGLSTISWIGTPILISGNSSVIRFDVHRDKTIFFLKKSLYNADKVITGQSLRSVDVLGMESEFY